jgi:NitT/TauT family transport system permease protein
MHRAIQPLLQVGLIAIILGGWEAAARIQLFNPKLLPPPTAVAPHIVAFLTQPEMLYHLWVTSSQVVTAFVLVAPIGIALGLLLGENDYLGRAFKPFFYFVASVPKSVFLPVFILAFGIGFTEKVAFGMFQAIFVLVISAIAAANSVPGDLITVARSYGAKRWQLYTQIYWPAMLPVLLEGIRLAMIFNITGVVFAEMYVARAGLGSLISNWGMSFQMPELFSGIALTAAFSIIINETLRYYERRVGRWRA